MLFKMQMAKVMYFVIFASSGKAQHTVFFKSKHSTSKELYALHALVTLIHKCLAASIFINVMSSLLIHNMQNKIKYRRKGKDI